MKKTYSRKKGKHITISATTRGAPTTEIKKRPVLNFKAGEKCLQSNTQKAMTYWRYAFEQLFDKKLPDYKKIHDTITKYCGETLFNNFKNSATINEQMSAVLGLFEFLSEKTAKFKNTDKKSAQFHCWRVCKYKVIGAHLIMGDNYYQAGEIKNAHQSYSLATEKCKEVLDMQSFTWLYTYGSSLIKLASTLIHSAKKKDALEEKQTLLAPAKKNLKMAESCCEGVIKLAKKIPLFSKDIHAINHVSRSITTYRIRILLLEKELIPPQQITAYIAIVRKACRGETHFFSEHLGTKLTVYNVVVEIADLIDQELKAGKLTEEETKQYKEIRDTLNQLTIEVSYLASRKELLEKSLERIKEKKITLTDRSKATVDMTNGLLNYLSLNLPIALEHYMSSLKQYRKLGDNFYIIDNLGRLIFISLLDHDPFKAYEYLAELKDAFLNSLDQTKEVTSEIHRYYDFIIYLTDDIQALYACMHKCAENSQYQDQLSKLSSDTHIILKELSESLSKKTPKSNVPLHESIVINLLCSEQRDLVQLHLESADDNEKKEEKKNGKKELPLTPKRHGTSMAGKFPHEKAFEYACNSYNRGDFNTANIQLNGCEHFLMNTLPHYAEIHLANCALLRARMSLDIAICTTSTHERIQHFEFALTCASNIITYCMEVKKSYRPIHRTFFANDRLPFIFDNLHSLLAELHFSADGYHHFFENLTNITDNPEHGLTTEDSDIIVENNNNEQSTTVIKKRDFLKDHINNIQRQNTSKLEEIIARTNLLLRRLELSYQKLFDKDDDRTTDLNYDLARTSSYDDKVYKL